MADRRWNAATLVLGIWIGALAFLAAPGTAFAASGSLGYLESEVDGVGGVGGLDNPDATAVSPDGKNVYVAACGSASVAVFSRNPSTGALSFIEAEKNGVGGVTGLLCASDVVVSPDGRNVYVAGSDSGAVAVFSRDPASGALSFVEAETGGSPPFPDGLSISPDGAQVYVAAYGFGGGGVGDVLTYTRDPSTGALTFSADAGGVGGATSIALSPDGKSAYATASSDNALAIFSRNTTTGALTPAGVLNDGAGGVDGLAQGSAVAVSRDGASVYVTAFVDSSLATFARNTTTGALAFAGIARNDLGAAMDVAVSPDDTNVYAVSFGDRALVNFARNTTTGAVTFVDANKKTDRGDDGLSGPWGLSLSPDGKNAYVAALGGDAVSTFVRNPPPFTPTLTAKRKQKATALAATAQCSLGCDYTAKAKIKIKTRKKKAKKFKAEKLKGTLPGLAPKALAFKFSSKQLKAIAKALKHGKGTATITLSTFAGSEAKAATATVKLKR
jgi:DNA-binding beta-propeller fold protein YncE